MATLSPLTASLYVALGGGIGAVLRYQLGRAITHWLGISTADAFPWSTLTVNIIGSCLMGLLFGWVAKTGIGEGEAFRLFIGVGILGGFTTFSAFSLETFHLIERGQTGLAASYAVVSVLAGLAALYCGLLTARAIA
jgi:CrcB protein